MSSSKPHPFPITAAQLAGNFCQTLFYGMYLVTCAFCARTLLFTGAGRDERWLRPQEIRWLMATVAFALFVISTLDVATGLLHNFHAFVESDDPLQEFLNISDWINITRTVDQILAMILGDFVLIYRCWVVYGRRWQIVLPSLVLYFASLAMAGKMIQLEAQVVNPNVTLASGGFTAWFVAFYGITGAQNILTTSILIWRIWRVERESEKYSHRSSGFTFNPPSHLRKVIGVIAESGAAYTAMVFITFIVSLTQSNALYPTSDITLQMTGIAFNVILVRSSTSRDKEFTVFDNNMQTLTVLD